MRLCACVGEHVLYTVYSVLITLANGLYIREALNVCTREVVVHVLHETHTQPRSHTVLVTRCVPGTVGCRRRSLEGLLILVEESVTVPLELERELRAAAAHLQRFTVAGIGTSRGRHCGRRRSLTSAAKRRGLSSRAQKVQA